ncbi:MAG: HK97 gp10 family phage protein [Magnetococcus sp. YQC-5]
MIGGIHIDGLKEISDAMLKLPQKVAANALRQAVYAGAVVIRNEARQRAPVNTGTLRRSIIVRRPKKKTDRNVQKMEVAVRRGKKYRNQGRRGNLSQDAWYWHFIEFGTKATRRRQYAAPARPFMRPAFDAKKMDAVTAIANKLRTSIEAKGGKVDG